MDLDDLRSFASVVRHGGFSAAERITGEARGKLSKRVARLERELGTRLLERSTRSVRITAVGQEVFQQCEIIADGIAATRAIADRAREDVSGSLRVSCPPGLARYLGADLLASFLMRYPEVRVERHLTARRVDLIKEGFDIALRIEIHEDTDLSLTIRQLGKSQRLLVASPEFVDKHPQISMECLSSLPTLAISDHVEQDKWDLVSDSGEHVRIVHKPRLCSNDSMVVRTAAIKGLGIALLSEQTCISDIADGRLTRILPDWHTRDGIVHMAFPARRGMSAAQRAFIDHYASQVAFLSQSAKD